ncbi:MAG: hypothetical protein GJ676_04255 [Rhodobacteraceae bacterium]|nr:hypothetical protein [Paracoccaceae bacterium]
MFDEFLRRGWVRFPFDEQTLAWAENARLHALKAAQDPAHADWLQCQSTWFIGVDALNNDATGQTPDGPPLAGASIDFITRHIGPIPDLHKAQVSIMYPGYPKPREGEGEAAFRYRLNRDAAHVDGVKMMPGVAGRRRNVDEPHAWVLGLPLNVASSDASPLVVWEGSHQIMHRAFAAAFEGHAPETLSQLDITDIYTQARAEVFESCRRVTVHAAPGEAYLMHRLTLHGVAPWADTATAPEGEGRIVAYFRPEVIGGVARWLEGA